MSTLFDKSIKSFFATAGSISYTHALPPKMLISDVSLLSAQPILNHIIHKAIESDTFQHVFIITADPDRCVPELFGFDATSHQSVHFISPRSTITTIPNPLNVSIEYVTTQPLIDDLRSFYDHIVKSTSDFYAASATTTPSTGLLLFDNISLFTIHPVGHIMSFLTALQALPYITGLVARVSTDVLCPHITALDSLHPSSSASTHPVDVFDYLATNFPIIFQTLPAPTVLPPNPATLHLYTHSTTNSIITQAVSSSGDSATATSPASASSQSSSKHNKNEAEGCQVQDYDGTCFASVRVTYRHSNHKVSTDLLSLWTYHRSSVVKSSVYSFEHFRDTTAAATNAQSNASSEGDELLRSLGNLPFKLSLTQQQQNKRANVELPYAHQGTALTATSLTGSILGEGLLTGKNAKQNWTVTSASAAAAAVADDDRNSDEDEGM